MSSVLEAVRSQNSVAPIEQIETVDALHELVQDLQDVTDRAARLEDVPEIFRNADTLRAIDARIAALRGRVDEREIARVTAIERRFALLREILAGRKAFQRKNAVDRKLDKVMPETMSRDEKRVVAYGAAGVAVAAGGLIALQFTKAGRKIREKAGDALAAIKIALVGGVVIGAGVLGFKVYGELKKYKEDLEAAQRAVREARAKVEAGVEKAKDTALEQAVATARSVWTSVTGELRTGRHPSAEAAQRELRLKMAAPMLVPGAKERILKDAGVDGGKKVRVDSDGKVHAFDVAYADPDGFTVEHLYQPEYLRNGGAQSVAGLAALSPDAFGALKDEQRPLLVKLCTDPLYAPVRAMKLRELLAVADPAAAPVPLRGDVDAVNVVRMIAKACEARKALAEPSLKGRDHLDLTLEEYLAAASVTTKPVARLDEALRASAPGSKPLDRLKASLDAAFDARYLDADLAAVVGTDVLMQLGVARDKHAAFLTYCKEHNAVLESVDAPPEFRTAVTALNESVWMGGPHLKGYLHHHQEAAGPALDAALKGLTLADAVRLHVAFHPLTPAAAAAPTPAGDQAAAALQLQLQVLRLVWARKPELTQEMQYLLRDNRKHDHAKGTLADPSKAGEGKAIALPPDTQRLLLNLIKGTSSATDRALAVREALEGEAGRAIFTRSLHLQYDALGYPDNDRPKYYEKQADAIVRAVNLKIFAHVAWTNGDDGSLRQLIRDAGLPAFADDAGYLAGAKLVLSVLKKARPMLERVCVAEGMALNDMTLGQAVDFMANANKAGSSLSADLADDIKGDLIPSIGLDLLNKSVDNAKRGGQAGDKVRDRFAKSKEAFKSKMAQVVAQGMLTRADLEAAGFRLEPQPADRAEPHLRAAWQDDQAQIDQACAEFVTLCVDDGGELRALPLQPEDSPRNKLKNKLIAAFRKRVGEQPFIDGVMAGLEYAIGGDQALREKTTAIVTTMLRDGTIGTSDAFQLYYLTESGKLSQNGGRFMAMMKAIAVVREQPGQREIGAELYARAFRKITVAAMRAAGKAVDEALDPGSEIPAGMEREFRNSLCYFRDELKDKLIDIDAGLGGLPGWAWRNKYYLGGTAGGLVVLRTYFSFRRAAAERQMLNTLMKGLGDTLRPGFGVRMIRAVPGVGPLIADAIVGNRAKTVIDAIKAKGGADAVTMAKALKAGGVESWDDVARAMRKLGGVENVDDMAKALKAAGCDKVDDLGKALKAAGWDKIDDVLKGLKAAGFTELDDLAKGLKAAGFEADAVKAALGRGPGGAPGAPKAPPAEPRAPTSKVRAKAAVDAFRASARGGPAYKALVDAEQKVKDLLAAGKALNHPEVLAAKSAENLARAKCAEELLTHMGKPGAGKFVTAAGELTEEGRKLIQIHETVAKSGPRGTLLAKTKALEKLGLAADEIAAFLRAGIAGDASLAVQLAQAGKAEVGVLETLTKAGRLTTSEAALLKRAIETGKLSPRQLQWLAEAAKGRALTVAETHALKAAVRPTTLGAFGQAAFKGLIVVGAGIYLFQIGEAINRGQDWQKQHKEAKDQIDKELRGAGFESADNKTYTHTESGITVKLHEYMDRLENSAYSEAGIAGFGLAGLLGSAAVGGPVGIAIGLGVIAIEVTVGQVVKGWQNAERLKFLSACPAWLLAAVGSQITIQKTPQQMLEYMAEWHTGEYAYGIFNDKGAIDALKPGARQKLLFLQLHQELALTAPELIAELFPGGGVAFRSKEQLFETDFKELVLPYYYCRLREHMGAGNDVQSEALFETATPRQMRLAMREAAVVYLNHVREKRYVELHKRLKAGSPGGDGAIERQLFDAMGEETVLGMRLKDIDVGQLEALSAQGSRTAVLLRRMGKDPRPGARAVDKKGIPGLPPGADPLDPAFAYATLNAAQRSQLERIYEEVPDKPGFELVQSDVAYAANNLYVRNNGIDPFSFGRGPSNPVGQPVQKQSIGPLGIGSRAGESQSSGKRKLTENAFIAMRGGQLSRNTQIADGFGFDADESNQDRPVVLSTSNRYYYDTKKKDMDARHREEEARCADIQRALFREMKDHPVFGGMKIVAAVYEQDNYMVGKLQAGEKSSWDPAHDYSSAIGKKYDENNRLVTGTFFLSDGKNVYVLRNAGFEYRNEDFINGAKSENWKTVYGEPQMLELANYVAAGRREKTVWTEVQAAQARQVTEAAVAASDAFADEPRRIEPEAHAFKRDEKTKAMEDALLEGENHPLLFIHSSVGIDEGTPGYDLAASLLEPEDLMSDQFDRAPSAIFIEILGDEQKGKLTAVANYVQPLLDEDEDKKEGASPLIRRRGAVSAKGADGTWDVQRGTRSGRVFQGVEDRALAADDSRMLMSREGSAQKLVAKIQDARRERDGTDMREARDVVFAENDANAQTVTRNVFFRVAESQDHFAVLDDGTELLFAGRVEIPGAARYRLAVRDPDTGATWISDVQLNGAPDAAWLAANKPQADAALEKAKSKFAPDAHGRLRFVAVSAVPAGEHDSVTLRFGERAATRLSFRTAAELMSRRDITYVERDAVIRALTIPMESDAETLERMLRLFPYDWEGGEAKSSKDALKEKLLPVLAGAPDKQVYLRRLFDVLLAQRFINARAIAAVTEDKELAKRADAVAVDRRRGRQLELRDRYVLNIMDAVEPGRIMISASAFLADGAQPVIKNGTVSIRMVKDGESRTLEPVDARPPAEYDKAALLDGTAYVSATDADGRELLPETKLAFVDAALPTTEGDMSASPAFLVRPGQNEEAAYYPDDAEQGKTARAVIRTGREPGERSLKTPLSYVNHYGPELDVRIFRADKTPVELKFNSAGHLRGVPPFDTLQDLVSELDEPDRAPWLRLIKKAEGQLAKARTLRGDAAALQETVGELIKLFAGANLGLRKDSFRSVMMQISTEVDLMVTRHDVLQAITLPPASAVSARPDGVKRKDHEPFRADAARSVRRMMDLFFYQGYDSWRGPLMDTMYGVYLEVSERNPFAAQEFLKDVYFAFEIASDETKAGRIGELKGKIAATENEIEKESLRRELRDMERTMLLDGPTVEAGLALLKRKYQDDFDAFERTKLEQRSLKGKSDKSFVRVRPFSMPESFRLIRHVEGYDTHVVRLDQAKDKPNPDTDNSVRVIGERTYVFGVIDGEDPAKPEQRVVVNRSELFVRRPDRLPGEEPPNLTPAQMNRARLVMLARETLTTPEPPDSLEAYHRQTLQDIFDLLDFDPGKDGTPSLVQQTRLRDALVPLYLRAFDKKLFLDTLWKELQYQDRTVSPGRVTPERSAEIFAKLTRMDAEEAFLPVLPTGFKGEIPLGGFSLRTERKDGNLTLKLVAVDPMFRRAKATLKIEGDPLPQGASMPGHTDSATTLTPFDLTRTDLRITVRYLNGDVLADLPLVVDGMQHERRLARAAATEARLTPLLEVVTQAAAGDKDALRTALGEFNAVRKSGELGDYNVNDALPDATEAAMPVFVKGAEAKDHVLISYNRYDGLTLAEGERALTLLRSGTENVWTELTRNRVPSYRLAAAVASFNRGAAALKEAGDPFVFPEGEQVSLPGYARKILKVNAAAGSVELTDVTPEGADGAAEAKVTGLIQEAVDLAEDRGNVGVTEASVQLRVEAAMKAYYDLKSPPTLLELCPRLERPVVLKGGVKNRSILLNADATYMSVEKTDKFND